METSNLKTTVTWVWVLLSGTGILADQPQVDYLREIKPILKERCFACHGALKQKSGLRLDTAAFSLQGGDSGPAVVAGNRAESLLLERIVDTNPVTRMPPEGMPLTAEQIALISAWVEQGAIAPSIEEPEQDPEKHWAFQRPQRPEVPRLSRLAATGHPIDDLILSLLEQRNLTPRPLAEPHVQMRRVNMDLIGVPPTQAELVSFLSDNSPVAYETLVDRLLADPRYGERWARHWMDIWRYSDWYGRRHVPDNWNSYPQIWRWRDWIVNSLNADRGYDRMIREMLAADEIVPEDDSAAVATGYLARNWYALNPNDWMRNTVEHTGKAFLGLTFNCAHCHDHKYDPISQDNYFQFRAFFEPIGLRQDRVVGQAEPGPFVEYSYGVLRKIERLGSVRVFDKTTDAPTWFYTGGDERNRVKDRGSIAPGVPDFLSETPLSIQSLELPPRAWYPGLRPAIQEGILQEARAAVARTEAEVLASRQKVLTVPVDVMAKIAKSESEYNTAREAALLAGHSGALAGQQSLSLDATQGRRVLANSLPGLKSLEDGSTFEFQLQIQKDAHFNLQFARDLIKGLTALYVGFNNGQILSYQPGTFNEFEVGRYDFAAGQTRFHVSLRIQTKTDRAELTVRALPEDKVIVEAVPVALNGWNPTINSAQGFSFDARTGSIIVLDNVYLNAPPNSEDSRPVRLAGFDFESPLYTDGLDILGIQGWEASGFGSAPATSMVSALPGNEKLRELAQLLHAARRAGRVPELQQLSADANLVAAQAELKSVEFRQEADNARFLMVPDEKTSTLIQTASMLERDAALKSAAARVLAQELAVAVAEAKPVADANRTKDLESATKSLTIAKTSLSTAQAALADAKSGEKYTAFSPTYPKTSSGRRKALAEWMTDRRHPLTARVAVNHIWNWHFQQPLVTTVSDFGRNGAVPSNPPLLDWLAVELMESNWSMKHLHRLIVTSSAYRRNSSSGNAPNEMAADPENKLLWRMNTGRMEAEVVRDSLLFVAGKLDLTPGGQELENSQALSTFRRSLYYSFNPENDGKNELSALFDAPDPLDCYRRSRSIVPQQALALTNSDLVHQVSGLIATELWNSSLDSTVDSQERSVSESSRESNFITAAYRRILTRTPKPEEFAACQEFLAKSLVLGTSSNVADPALRARESLIRALLNHNDFITIR